MESNARMNCSFLKDEQFLLPLVFKESQNMTVNLRTASGALNPDVITSKSIDKIIILDQAEYDALTPDTRTLYFIKG